MVKRIGRELKIVGKVAKANKTRLLAPPILAGPIPFIGTIVSAGILGYLYYKHKRRKEEK